MFTNVSLAKKRRNNSEIKDCKLSISFSNTSEKNCRGKKESRKKGQVKGEIRFFYGKNLCPHLAPLYDEDVA